MTIPIERTRAILNVRRFLRDCLKSLIRLKRRPKAAQELFNEIRYLLKHYPMDSDLAKACKDAPDVFEKVPELDWEICGSCWEKSPVLCCHSRCKKCGCGNGCHKY